MAKMLTKRSIPTSGQNDLLTRRVGLGRLSRMMVSGPAKEHGRVSSYQPGKDLRRGVPHPGVSKLKRKKINVGQPLGLRYALTNMAYPTRAR